MTKVEEHEDAYDATKDRLAELDVERVDLMLIRRPPAAGAGVGLWECLQLCRLHPAAAEWEALAVRPPNACAPSRRCNPNGVSTERRRGQAAS